MIDKEEVIEYLQNLADELADKIDSAKGTRQGDLMEQRQQIEGAIQIIEGYNP
jgi:hypothetical protein